MENDNYVMITDENVAEINPTASSDLQQSFIDNYRQIQGENTAAIVSVAHALGSDLEAPYGGLHGPSEYMKSRYQTPQTESRVAALRTAAQLSALNQLMQNDQNRWQNRYNQAYRNAQKRQRARQNALYDSLSGGSNKGNDPANYDPEVEYDYTNRDVTSGITTVPIDGRNTTTRVDTYGNTITYDTDTGEWLYFNGKSMQGNKTVQNLLQRRDWDNYYRNTGHYAEGDPRGQDYEKKYY